MYMRMFIYMWIIEYIFGELQKCNSKNSDYSESYKKMNYK